MSLSLESTPLESRPQAQPTQANLRVISPDPLFHWVFLGLALVILSLSLSLALAEGPRQVIIPWLNRPMPSLCGMQTWFGVDCPGCGLTRSFISLAHGHWRAAVRFNPVGPFLFFLVAFQVPYRLLQLRRINRGLPEYRLGSWGNSMIGIAMLALLLQWSLRIFAGWTF